MSGEGVGEGIRKEGEGIGEGIHPPEHISPIGQRERAQKEAGNPTEKQAEVERISRDEARHRFGFPVAGHDERDEGRGRSR